MRLTKEEKRIVELLKKGAWNPFKQVSGKLLEKLHKQSVLNSGEAKW